MSLTINLSADYDFTLKPAETISFSTSGNYEIKKITDYPVLSAVYVDLDPLGRIYLEDLSGENYDQPSEWTNSDIKDAIIKYIQTN